MKQKLIPLFFAFLAAIAVKAGGIEIDSIRHPLIIDGRTDATLVKPSEGRVPSRKAAPSKIALQNTGDENFNLVTTGTFTSTFSQNSSGAPYSYTAELRQSNKNPNRFLITPFIDNDEGMIIEITHKKNDAGAYILKVTPAATGYEHPSYGMVNARDGESSSFDGTTFRLNLEYYVNARSFGEFPETFEIPAGLVAYTEGPDDGILLYSITDIRSHEVSVVELKDTERTTVDIPESVDKDGVTYSVTGIGEYVFYYCTDLTSVTIPNSVKSIGVGAFRSCIGLTSVTIPNSVTSIGELVFYGCTGLTSVSIGNSVTSIGGSAFQACSNLTSVTIPNSVTSIGEYAFYECTSLTSIDIPNSVTSIGKYAFGSCIGLTSVSIGNSVTSIGEYAFYECTSLTSIDIPYSVTSIGKYAFGWCTGLKDVYALRTSPAEYGADGNCFDDVPTSTCTLHVPAGCKDAYANSEPWSQFGNIVELQNTGDEYFNLVTTGTFTSTFFKNSSGAPYSYTAELRQSDKNPNRFLITPFFDNDEGMFIEITHKKNDAGAYILKVTPAATGYEHLSYGMVNAREGESSSFDGTTFRLNLSYNVNVGSFGGFSETFEIPAGLVAYTEGPDDGILLYSITDIRSHEVSVVELKDTERTTVDIPESVDMNGETYSVTGIGDEAFCDCTGLTNITIPKSVTSIGVGAFQFCTGLKDVYALRTSPAEYGADGNCFDDVPTSTCTLHVPAGCKDAYASLAPWSAFENIVEFEPTAINQLEHNAEKNVSESFNLQGQRISVPQRGVNIIRYSDGTSKKILVK